MASSLEKKFFEETFGASHLRDLEDEIEQTNSFEHMCKAKLVSLNLSPADFVKANNFIEIVDRIQKRYPFLYLPNFLENFMSGVYSRKLLKTYHLRNFLEFNYLTEVILKLKGTRQKSSHRNALEKNLENKQWREIYDNISKFSSIFESELILLLNKNLLRAIIISCLFEKPFGISYSMLSENLKHYVEQNKERIHLFEVQQIFDSFNNYLNNGLENKIDEIIQDLYNKGFIRKEFSDEQLIYINTKFSKIEETILKIIESSPDGIFHDNFHRALLRNLPILKLAPKIGIWESILKKLEENQIVRIKNFWKYSPYRDQLFTRENYGLKMAEIRKQIVAAGTTKFFGRQIDPTTFLNELESLSKGDFDDVDDQVTRIAGLVLASSAILQTPHENLKLFDFAVDVSNYTFTEQQMQAMQRVNFSVVGTILHCKVMIDEQIDASLINEIKKILPTGHQAIIFSFKQIPNNVKSIISSDKSIQIVDKEGITAWTSITPVIPCRVGSIAKIMYGDMRGKIVQVNSINYESGLASVIDFANNEESTYIGSLEEIWFGNFSPAKYGNALKRYFEFLSFLANNAKDIKTFEQGIFEPNIQQAEYISTSLLDENKIHTDAIDITKNEKYYPLPSSDSKLIEWKIKTNDVDTSIKYVKFKNGFGLELLNHYSKISHIGQFMKCGCVFFNEQPYSPKFCSHMISACDFIAKRLDCFDDSWETESGNIIKKILQKYSQLKHYSTIEYAYGWLDEDDFTPFIDLMKNIWKTTNSIYDDKEQTQAVELEDKLVQKIDSEEFSNVIKKIKSVVSEMREDDFSNVLDTIKTKHEDILDRKRRRRF